MFERRIANLKTEVRKRGGAVDSQAALITGYGARFNSETVIGCWFRETIKPGAFAAVIGAGADVRSLFNHDANYVLGRTTAGTCRLREDDQGLVYEDDVNPDDPQAVGVAARIARGDVTGSSFGFRVKREEWIDPDEGSKDLPLRIIHEFAALYDVGPVTFPAYESTTSEARDAVRAILSGNSVPAHVRTALEATLEQRGSVPKNVSTKKAPTDTAWSAPSLEDFYAGKTWDELTSAQRSHVTGHYAWKAGDTFGDLHLPHHRATDGAIVLRGVVAAAGRLNQTDGVDKSAVRAHLEAHYHAFDLKAPWEKDASSERDVDAAIARQERDDTPADEDGEEAAELVHYQTMANLCEQARTGLDSCRSVIQDLIDDETETPTESAADEAAETNVESARLNAVLSHCRQVSSAVDSASQHAQRLLQGRSARSTPPVADNAADADRGRALQLAEATCARGSDR